MRKYESHKKRKFLRNSLVWYGDLFSFYRFKNEVYLKKKKIFNYLTIYYKKEIGESYPNELKLEINYKDLWSSADKIANLSILNHLNLQKHSLLLNVMSINRVLKFSSLIFSFILIYYLLSTGQVYNYLVPEDNKSELGLFRDWIVTLNDIYCQSSNKNGCRPFQYGPILLYLPFNDIKDFYYNQFPILLIILIFLFLILKK